MSWLFSSLWSGRDHQGLVWEHRVPLSGTSQDDARSRRRLGSLEDQLDHQVPDTNHHRQFDQEGQRSDDKAEERIDDDRSEQDRSDDDRTMPGAQT